MGNHRLLLYFTLFFIIYMIWAQWQLAYGPKPEVVAESTTVTASSSEKSMVPEAASTPGAISSDSPLDKQAGSASQRIKIITDILDVEVDSKGGDVLRTVLRDYPVSADKPEEKLVLLTDANINYQVAQSGLVSVNENTAPSHNAVYSSEKEIYRLAEGEDVIEVPLYWEGANGVKIKKVLTF